MVGGLTITAKKAKIECTCPKRLPKPKKKKPIKKTNPVYIEAMKLAIANSEKGNVAGSVNQTVDLGPQIPNLGMKDSVGTLFVGEK